jgi:hypothetical protein
MGALEAMLPKAAKAGDDWGWKGGKPGEITGSEYFHEIRDKAWLRADAEAKKLLKKPNASMVWDEDFKNLHKKLLDQTMQDTDNKVLKQFQSSKNPYFSSIKNSKDAGLVLHDLNMLEASGIPRRWTGKVLPALRETMNNDYAAIPQPVARNISDLMRTMTNDQRETFVSLLPEWGESLDDLADLARNI